MSFQPAVEPANCDILLQRAQPWDIWHMSYCMLDTNDVLPYAWVICTLKYLLMYDEPAGKVDVWPQLFSSQICNIQTSCFLLQHLAIPVASDRMSPAIVIQLCHCHRHLLCPGNKCLLSAALWTEFANLCEISLWTTFYGFTSSTVWIIVLTLLQEGIWSLVIVIRRRVRWWSTDMIRCFT